jgi:quinol-cytochrome oxidoreductase complex cytochrome b subunit
LITEAFLGYTLVWSQISFWAGTVITSLISVIPFFGLDLIFFIWGGFYLNTFSLKLFFFFHFILPLIIFVLVFFHLVILHYYGSTNKLINGIKLSKRTFFPFYWVKDLVNLLFSLLTDIFFIIFPFDLNEPLSFVIVNNLVSPNHIIPE